MATRDAINGVAGGGIVRRRAAPCGAVRHVAAHCGTARRTDTSSLWYSKPSPVFARVLQQD